MNPTRTIRTELLRGLIVAAVLLAASAAIRFFTPVPIRPDLASRLLGALMGALVMFYANDVPKALAPLAESRCDPVAKQALQRFAGWTLTLGGLGYVIASLVAPIGIAGPVAMGLLGTALLLVLARVGWTVARGTRN